VPAFVSGRISLDYVKSLRDRTIRDRDGLVFVEGVRFVATAIDAGMSIEAIIVAPDRLQSPLGHTLARRLARQGVPLLRVRDDEFVALSLLDEPQGIGAVVRQRFSPLDEDEPRRDSLWVGLDELHKPGNFGSLLRTCDAVGAGGVILLSARIDPYDPTVVRATMGSIFSQRLVRTTPSAFRRWNRHGAHFVVGAGLDGRCDYRAVSYRRPVLLMLGGERHGLSPAQASLCDAVVRIPMRGRCDSLNLAAAGAVMLYEIHSQRHPIRRRG
jgi:TrmH family RNA methyltransferase